MILAHYFAPLAPEFTRQKREKKNTKSVSPIDKETKTERKRKTKQNKKRLESERKCSPSLKWFHCGD